MSQPGFCRVCGTQTNGNYCSQQCLEKVMYSNSRPKDVVKLSTNQVKKAIAKAAKKYG